MEASHTISTKLRKVIDYLPTEENIAIHSRELFNLTKIIKKVLPGKWELQLFKSKPKHQDSNQAFDGHNRTYILREKQV